MSEKVKIKSPKRKRLTVFFILLGVVIAAASIATYLIINAQAKPVAFDDEEALYSTRYLETPTDGSNPTNYNAEDNIAIALYTTEHQNGFKSVTQGSSDAGVAIVTVNDYRVVIGDEAITATVSDGIVSFGKMKYFSREKEVALLREVKTIKDGQALSWSDDTPACVSFKTYKQMYGCFPYNVSGYIICPETILSSEFLTNDDGTFTVKLKLNPDGDYAPYYYRRTVATNGSSSMIPEFEFINLDFTFNSDWKILYVRSNEKYLVKSMGIKAASETDCTETFTYNDVSFNQPDYDYFMQYKDLKPSDITPQTKTDILTLLVESLMNGGEPRTFNFTIKENRTCSKIKP